MSVRPLREQVSDEEWRLRVDLAACYRLVALYGMQGKTFIRDNFSPCIDSLIHRSWSQ